MDNETTAKIMPLRFVSQDEEAERLHRILSCTNGCNNKLLKYIWDLLTYIDKEDICVSDNNALAVLILIGKSLNIPEEQVDFIVKFIEEQGLVEIKNGKIVITPQGKVFYLSDKISASIDIIKYIWEKLDWKEISGCNNNNRFLEKEGRRYTSCLLSQLNNKYKSVEEVKKKYEYMDFYYESNIYILQEMLRDKYVRRIIECIFEPLGLIQKSSSFYRLSDFGKKVFEFFSYNMQGEYNELIDECWDSYDKGNFQEAFETAVSIIRVAGTILEAYNIIGCVHIRKGEYNKAKDVFMYAIELYEERNDDLNANWCMAMETYISMYYNVGLCDFYNGNFIKALHTFMSIKETLPYKLESLEVIITTIKKMIIIK